MSFNTNDEFDQKVAIKNSGNNFEINFLIRPLFSQEWNELSQMTDSTHTTMT